MRWKRLAAILWVLASIFAFGRSADAAFNTPTDGVRPSGIGGSFTAIADDGNAPLYNPAGAASIEGARAMFARTAFFSGPTDPLIAQDSAFIVTPAGPGAITIGGTRLADRNGVYSETEVAFGYAIALGENVRVGVLGRSMRAGVDAGLADVAENPYFAEATVRTGFTADVGLLVNPTEALSFGLSGQGLIPADLAFSSAPEAEPDRRPVVVRAGVAYRLEKVAASAEQAALADILARSLVAADVALGDGAAIGVGAEIGLSRAITGRIGYRTASGRGRSVGAVTLGGSIAVDVGVARTYLDYALDLANSALKDNLSQRLALRVAF